MRYPKLMRLPTSLALILLLTGAALAGQTGWREIAPDVKVRLVSAGSPTPDGTMLVGLDIRMPDHVKTYWRVPGETGIPTTLDLSGSTGIASHRVIWPYPKVEVTSGYLDYTYYGSRLVPVELKLIRGAVNPFLKVRIAMGVCSEICVPTFAQLGLELQLTERDPGSELRLQQALADAPLPMPPRATWISTVEYDAANRRLVLAVDPANLDPGSVIADTGSTDVLFGPPQKSPTPGIIYLPLLGSSTDRPLAGRLVTLTFLSPRGPYETTKRVAVAD